MEFLRGCSHIIHGGDIGSPSILHDLSALAPLTAVRGNNDKGPWASALPATEFVQLGKVSVYVLHDLSRLDIDPKSADVGIVVSGHSHQPLIERRGAVLYVNPGSAGPRRFKLPVALGEIVIAGNSVRPRIVELSVGDDA